MRFSRGKIWFVDIGPCKRFDILLICSISYSMVPTLLVAVSILLVSAFLALLLGTLNSYWLEICQVKSIHDWPLISLSTGLFIKMIGTEEKKHESKRNLDF